MSPQTPPSAPDQPAPDQPAPVRPDAGGARKPRVQHVLTVQQVRRLSPHLVRVVLGGEGFAALEFKDATDQYIKMLFADPALGLDRPYDLDALRERLPMEQMPVTRTYTVRHIDHDAGQLWVDMVTHGEEGLAGGWAQQVRPGELISFFGPGGAYAPREEADWHLLAGDESALPAIAAAVEALEPTPAASSCSKCPPSKTRCRCCAGRGGGALAASRRRVHAGEHPAGRGGGEPGDPCRGRAGLRPRRA
ncbi:siderophore-interacting protein [Nesterenkonia sp. PF2B19]|uniref:siderophore-interacting protein n=1 Tax=Nesterenkonia sp. PF2B19 TaxID=1881858 RepID=UPI00268D4978